MPGLWFEEFSPGQTFDHPITRTVTEMDNMLFSNMTLNPQPLHIDFHFAAGTEFGKPLVNSLFTLGLMIGISVHDTTLKTTIANLGMTDVNFPAPVFHGDSIRVVTTVEALRASKSRPDAGSSPSDTGRSTRTTKKWRAARASPSCTGVPTATPETGPPPAKRTQQVTVRVRAGLPAKTGRQEEVTCVSQEAVQTRP